jgi:hypothetical protein
MYKFTLEISTYKIHKKNHVTWCDVNNMCSQCLCPVVDKYVWNKLLSPCNKVDEDNRLAQRCSDKCDSVYT